LFRLVDDCYEGVKGTWEERFEAKYGRWRGFVDDVVYAFAEPRRDGDRAPVTSRTPR